ncbi:MAG: inositol monophosphatase family protein [Gemmatimonadaceae bacterium]
MSETVFDDKLLASIRDAALSAAHAGEEIIRAGAARLGSLQWQTKGPADYVTEIDTSSEAVIRERLQHALEPHFGHMPVLGEESWSGGMIPHGLCFVVDPLDGTTNFLHGVPAYAVSIAALHDGEPVVGVVRHAALDETYSAIRGAGAWLNGERMRVSSIVDPARSLIATGIPFGGRKDVARYARQLVPVAAATAGLRRAGAAALDLAGVAAGRYEAFWELQLSPWDIAAGILMIEEAGGVVTDLDGRRANIESSPLVAGSPAMHAWLIDVLQSSESPGTA